LLKPRATVTLYNLPIEADLVGAIIEFVVLLTLRETFKD
jgi:hypothetical protein